MYNFQCEICGDQHRFITLFEFPPPAIISEISSGVLDQTLNVFAKNSYIVNRDYLIIGCQLTLAIIDDEDELDMLVWARVTKEEFKSQREYYKDKDQIVLKGILDRRIPFYENTNALQVEIQIGPDINKSPFVSKINTANKLKDDFTNGIKLNRLKEILMKLYHELYK